MVWGYWEVSCAVWAVRLFGRWKTERQKERKRQKRSFEWRIEKCRGNTNATCSHMTRCFNTLSLAAFSQPWIWKQIRNKNREWERNRKEGRMRGVKKYLLWSNSVWNFFGVDNCEKRVSWNNNRGHWAAQAECERESWLPSRDQVSVKARGRKEGLFYGRQGEKHTHTHSLCSPSPFLIHIHELSQMPGQREG